MSTSSWNSNHHGRPVAVSFRGAYINVDFRGAYIAINSRGPYIAINLEEVLSPSPPDELKIAVDFAEADVVPNH